MKRKTFFSVLGALLILQSAAAQKAVLDTVYLQLNLDSVGLDEVVVKGRRTPVANSRWSDMTPVDLVTVGGANGDLYKALQILPGTQVQGETGELLVRGGSSYETQTYIDGMHVLNPSGAQPLLHVYVQRCQSGFRRRPAGVWGGAFGGAAFGDERSQRHQ